MSIASGLRFGTDTMLWKLNTLRTVDLEADGLVRLLLFGVLTEHLSQKSKTTGDTGVF